MSSDFIAAVRALVYLNHRRETVSSGQLAKNICTNPARVRKVMAALRETGWREDTACRRISAHEPSAKLAKRLRCGYQDLLAQREP